MTIKAKFSDGSIMLFGNSYKKWYQQIAEYCRVYNQSCPLYISKCSSKWISYGGLKWCAEDALQRMLDEEMQGRKKEEFSDWKPLNIIEQRTLAKYFRSLTPPRAL